MLQAPDLNQRHALGLIEILPPSNRHQTAPKHPRAQPSQRQTNAPHRRREAHRGAHATSRSHGSYPRPHCRRNYLDSQQHLTLRSSDPPNNLRVEIILSSSLVTNPNTTPSFQAQKRITQNADEFSQPDKIEVEPKNPKGPPCAVLFRLPHSKWETTNFNEVILSEAQRSRKPALSWSKGTCGLQTSHTSPKESQKCPSPSAPTSCPPANFARPPPSPQRTTLPPSHPKPPLPGTRTRPQ